MKIGFVDDFVHKKTKSTEFLVEALSKVYEVKRFWGNGFKKFDKQELKNINDYNPDLILFFQRIPNCFIIQKFKCKNIIFVPMYDQEIYYSSLERTMVDISIKAISLIKDLKILTFSKADYQRYSNYDVLNVKYFPKVKNVKVDLKEVFFWERDNGISINELERLVPNENLRIKHKDLWVSRNKLDGLKYRCGIFVAPRLNEGIGHPFLEAMSEGRCVIAHNSPTHNEYIVNGVTGILYEDFKEVNLDNWKQIGKRSKEYIKNNRENWLEDIKRINEWVKL